MHTETDFPTLDLIQYYIFFNFSDLDNYLFSYNAVPGYMCIYMYVYIYVYTHTYIYILCIMVDRVGGLTKSLQPH